MAFAVFAAFCYSLEKKGRGNSYLSIISYAVFLYFFCLMLIIFMARPKSLVFDFFLSVIPAAFCCYLERRGYEGGCLFVFYVCYFAFLLSCMGIIRRYLSLYLVIFIFFLSMLSSAFCYFLERRGHERTKYFRISYKATWYLFGLMILYFFIHLIFGMLFSRLLPTF
jgi:hypothetical protein